MRIFKPKICEMCGRKFVPTNGKQIYCGSDRLKIGCSYKRSKDKHRTYRQKPGNKERARISHQSLEYREKARIYRQTPKHRLERYKFNAKKRGYGWALKDTTVYELFKQPCHYCGITDKIGIDRVDNSKGYTIENAVPCCSPCNKMKGTMLVEEFKNHCIEITKFNN